MCSEPASAIDWEIKVLSLPVIKHFVFTGIPSANQFSLPSTFIPIAHYSYYTSQAFVII